MGFVGRAWPDGVVKWDGIGVGRKIPPDLSQAGWDEHT